MAATLAGPVFTLLVGYVGLWSFRRRQSLIVWSLAYSAAATRPVVNLLFLTPRVIDGTIDSSDEAIAAFFLDWPLWSLWWLLVVGVVCAVLLVKALPRGARAPFAVTGFVSSFAGFFVIEYLVNTLVFDLDNWERSRPPVPSAVRESAPVTRSLRAPVRGCIPRSGSAPTAASRDTPSGRRLAR